METVGACIPFARIHLRTNIHLFLIFLLGLNQLAILFSKLMDLLTDEQLQILQLFIFCVFSLKLFRSYYLIPILTPQKNDRIRGKYGGELIHQLKKPFKRSSQKPRNHAGLRALGLMNDILWVYEFENQAGFYKLITSPKESVIQ